MPTEPGGSLSSIFFPHTSVGSGVMSGGGPQPSSLFSLALSSSRCGEIARTSHGKLLPTRARSRRVIGGPLRTPTVAPRNSPRGPPLASPWRRRAGPPRRARTTASRRRPIVGGGGRGGHPSNSTRGIAPMIQKPM